MPSQQPPGSRRRVAITPAPSQMRPGWLLGALGLLLLTAGLCAYLSLCLLFAQGQWQLLYRPAQHAGPVETPGHAGLAFTDLHFEGAHSNGELSGWWLPAEPHAALAGTTVLYLHDATGSLGDTVPELARLHKLGCAIFAIDYRGYGASAAGRPGEAAMLADTRSAMAYLVGTRRVGLGSLVVWGRGAGATLAGEVTMPRVRLVLQDANPPAVELLEADPRTRMLPVSWLVRDQLDAGPALRGNRTPKLFLVSTAAKPLSDGTQRLYTLAAGPKRLASSEDDALIRTFLLYSSEEAQSKQ